MYKVEKQSVRNHIALHVNQYQGKALAWVAKDLYDRTELGLSAVHPVTVRMWAETFCAERGIELTKRKYEPKSKLSAAEVKAQALVELEGCIMHQKDELAAFIRQYSDVSGKSQTDVHSMFKITLT